MAQVEVGHGMLRESQGCDFPTRFGLYLMDHVATVTGSFNSLGLKRWVVATLAKADDSTRYAAALAHSCLWKCGGCCNPVRRVKKNSRSVQACDWTWSRQAPYTFGVKDALPASISCQRPNMLPWLRG